MFSLLPVLVLVAINYSTLVSAAPNPVPSREESLDLSGFLDTPDDYEAAQSWKQPHPPPIDPSRRPRSRSPPAVDVGSSTSTQESSSTSRATGNRSGNFGRGFNEYFRQHVETDEKSQIYEVLKNRHTMFQHKFPGVSETTVRTWAGKAMNPNIKEDLISPDVRRQIAGVEAIIQHRETTARPYHRQGH